MFDVNVYVLPVAPSTMYLSILILFLLGMSHIISNSLIHLKYTTHSFPS